LGRVVGFADGLVFLGELSVGRIGHEGELARNWREKMKEKNSRRLRGLARVFLTKKRSGNPLPFAIKGLRLPARRGTAGQRVCERRDLGGFGVKTGGSEGQVAAAPRLDTCGLETFV
jgi:hypothetical protein